MDIQFLPRFSSKNLLTSYLESKNNLYRSSLLRCWDTFSYKNSSMYDLSCNSSVSQHSAENTSGPQSGNLFGAPALSQTQQALLSQTDWQAKIDSLVSNLQNDSSFDNASWNYMSHPTARELAKTLILSDPELQKQIAEEFSKGSPTASDIVSVLCSRDEAAITQVLFRFENVMVSHAKTCGLTETEKLLSSRLEQMDFYAHATFNDRMDSVLQDIQDEFRKNGLEFDASKSYEFVLDTESFTFKVSGGTEQENSLIEKVVNTTNILGHSYEKDNLGVILNNLINHRREDGSYNPWIVDSIRLTPEQKESEFGKYGVAETPDGYTEKISSLSTAYRWYCLDQRLQKEYGFGVDDLVYLGGEKIVGKTPEITKAIRENYANFMNKKGDAYIDLLSEYQGTPTFDSPVFTLEGGKFHVTYSET